MEWINQFLEVATTFGTMTLDRFESILGVLVGAYLAYLKMAFDRKKRLKRHWHNLAAEVDIARSRAAAYLQSDGNVKAPDFRLPTIAADRAFREIVTAGDLTEEEYIKIERYLSWVQDINRGLDTAAELNPESNESLLNQIHYRLSLKCERLVKDHYEPTTKVLNNHLKQPRLPRKNVLQPNT